MKAIVLFLDSRGMGGIETHVLNLAKALAERSLPVKVVFWKNYDDSEHPLWRDLKQADIPVYSAQGKIRQLFRLIPQGSLVHSHGYKGNLINKMFSLPGKWKALPTHHNGDTGSGRLKCYVQADELTSRWFSPLSVSAEIHQRLSHRGLLIPNFVDLKSQESLFKHQRMGSGEQIAFVGRLSPEKGPETFCQLANRLNDSMASESRAKLHLYGDGALYNPLSERYQQVIFHGQQIMSEHWHKIGVLCITSEYEGLPLAALEAMSQGIPVCSFAIGDLPALIEHGKNGWVVPAGDIEAMSCCLDQWLRMTPQKRQQMALNAYQTIQHHYSVQAVVPRIIEHYLHLAA